MSIPLEAANSETSHIHIAERRLLLRCLWKVGIPLDSKPGNHLSSRDDFWYTELSLSCSAELLVPLYLEGVLRESLELPKGSQATCHLS